MSFAMQFHVPGGFDPEPSTTTGHALHADVFRPPPSPSTSSYNLAKSTGSLFSDISMSAAAQTTGTAKRKRTSLRESTPLDWQMNADSANDLREQEWSREFRYTLAGQISTSPAAAEPEAENGELQDSVFSDVDYRRALGPRTVPGADSPPFSGAGATKTNASTLTGWSLLSLQTIGEVVGKVWEFCKKGAFRGFRAGGGQGYNEDGSTVARTRDTAWGADPDPPTPAAVDVTAMGHGAPEVYPQKPFSPYSAGGEDFSTPDSTPRPAVKRRQVSANNDELRNWVVVEEPGGDRPKHFAAEVKAAASRSGSFARPRSGYHYSQPPASSNRRIAAPSQRFTGGPNLMHQDVRPQLRISHAGSPSLTPREPASFASPRSSPASRPTPSRIPVPVQAPPQYHHDPNPDRFAIPANRTFPTSILGSSASRPSSRQEQARPARHAAGSSSSKSTLRGGAPSSPTKSKRNSTGNARPLSLGQHHQHQHTPQQHHRRSRSAVSPASPAPSAATAAAVTAPMTRPTTSSSRARPPRPAASSPSFSSSPVLRLDAEAQQLARRRLAAERDADARVDAFNARLLSMIRQGREALGTKVEVEMVDADDDDEDDEESGNVVRVGVGEGDGGGVAFHEHYEEDEDEDLGLELPGMGCGHPPFELGGVVGGVSGYGDRYGRSR